ncbi:substrate-binding domain-containing protein [Aquisediminimonas sediminicola]|uniref:substrate-binding domain-containing protein n=1 Tax=Alteraquisediminimonas sediminicola TaxID=2676787 RepID=UPI001C8D867B|nr:substrate-binding domain-containing protein [Aquisediminimonas sediminicola]
MKRAISTLSAISVALALTACGESGNNGGARDGIRAVGSSTVLPFAKAVADKFGQKNPNFKAPIVESQGTGGGFKLFCAGVGTAHPDIANASRRIKKSELDDCIKNGVKDIVEVQVGIDGIVLAHAKNAAPLTLSEVDVYKALAANPFGKPNTAKTWQDVNPALPAIAISVYGPPTSSGTRDAFAELILEKGCDSDPAMKALKDSDKDKHKNLCTGVREDGAYVDAGENDNLIVQKLVANPNAVGIFGFSFLEENADKVQGVAVQGVVPTYATIADYSYPGARPLFIYVKKAHLNSIPGIKEFLAEFASAWGPGGYLAKHGMIAAPEDVRKKNADVIANLTLLDPASIN